MLDTADAAALRQHQRSLPSPTLEGKADQNAAAIACRSLNIDAPALYTLLSGGGD